ncbi:Uma2 family endonuclease [Leptothermofonsia sichuanensis E412]|uniref:Uma2 family endonuclease n=1 Tax=Leptothermofonsia sichuanensis TaxID=2917832 RepID=UPI001CA60342|nr:Uma2 family endonuclease [Leptothermofonsia sichuanensis]QZZ21131.1 Uma2 family endonuclease [Leptothermofonsia sichuanensis E412]
MTQAARKLTFEEYASLDAEDWARLGLPEGRCEYWDGELFELPTESEPNDFIANFLMFLLASTGVIPLRLIRPHSCEIEVSGRPRTRYPDLVILRDEHISATKRRLFITLKMAPPQLVAEVVSPGNANQRRDYEAKRTQYQERGIPEYWLIDPDQQSITVLVLENGKYRESGCFKGSDRVVSPAFPTLTLTADQLFAGSS